LIIVGLWPVALVFVALAAFMAFFFRDPRRQPPTDANLVVAPADGRVTRVRPVGDLGERSATVISIFLSPFDVHINRAPIAGQHGVTHTNSEGRARLLAFEGLDYLLWADLGSWPSKRCAPVVKLEGNHSGAGPIVVRISLSQDACSEQEREARTAAHATQVR